MSEEHCYSFLMHLIPHFKLDQSHQFVRQFHNYCICHLVLHFFISLITFKKYFLLIWCGILTTLLEYIYYIKFFSF